MLFSQISVLLILPQVYFAAALPRVFPHPFIPPFIPPFIQSHWESAYLYGGNALTSVVQTGNLGAVSVSVSDAQSSQPSTFTSVVIIGDASLSLQTVISTDLPSTQTPTVTSASEGPQTIGSIVTTLQTDGNPSSLPYPTSLPSISESTLLPTDTIAPFDTSAATQPTSTAEETITVPQTTIESVVVSSTVTALPVETTATITTVSVFSTTDLYGNPTSSVGTTVVTITGTTISQTTISAASTQTSTGAETITTSGYPSSLPTGSTTACVFSIGCDGQDMFLPIDIRQPPANIKQRAGHPVPRLGIQNQTGPIETNKFYSNFYLGDQSSPAFPMPYSLTWAKGSGNAESWGIAISHIESNQKVFGLPNVQIPNQPASYYINPLGIQSLVLSAVELQNQTVLTTDSLQVLSANVHLSPMLGAPPVLTIPMVQGMAFVTGLYTNCQPVIQSSVFFRSVGAVSITSSGVSKYKVTLEDDKVWLIYAISDNEIAPNFELVSSTILKGINSWSGTIQIAKLPSGANESVYDSAAGTYPTTGSISGYASGDSAQYSLSWSKGGPYVSNTTLLMFALPHHVQSFDNNTQGNITDLSLDTLTKGVGRAVSADYWVLEERLPMDMSFMPWRPDEQFRVQDRMSASALAVAQNIAAIEASQNMSAQTNLDSMYYSGKGLSKFATLVFAMNNITQQEHLASSALAELKQAFNVFSNNEQQYPLVYDLDWKGVVSSASYVTGDSGADFGNSYYNDHHFHYGYFLQAASIIGYLDPSWLAANKDYINTLARDTSNPSSLDQYFPIFRSFDFYHGHSWAKGLFESGDGKDEESSSEDAMHAYGLKMWGQTTGDASMEARGNLMLAVLGRSLQNYFLMDSSNINQPAQFISNKVTGIMFENKVDHVTYFGTNSEYVQGIHMIPLMPFSTLTRTQQFVTEEWATYFADNATDPAWNVSGGWKGILYSNLAIINPTAALNFFTQANFDSSWLDGGATRTWYICLSALWGGQL
ncbi:hypothetical protein DV736_g1145, partial [Chaetothyriales sp. CBS 134916]